MQIAANEPSRKSLSLFLRERWHWLFIAASLALVLVRYMPAVYLTTISSDNLQACMLFRDVVEQGHSPHNWIYGGHSDLFPDITVVFLMEYLFHDGLLALQVLTSVIFAGWALGITMIYRECGGRNVAAFAALAPLFLLAVYRNFGSHHGLSFHDTFMLGNHSGTQGVVLVCVALCLHAALKGARSSCWWLCGLCFITAASDPLFLVIFPLPVLVALGLTRLAYPARIQCFVRIAACIAVPSALGFVLGKPLFPAGIASGYTQFAPIPARYSWHALLHALPVSTGGHFIVFVMIDLACILAAECLLFPRWFKAAAARIPLAVFLLLFFCSCMVACNWGAVILTGDFLGLGGYRYVRFALLLPVIMMIGYLHHLIPWPPIAARFAAAGFSLAAIFVVFFCPPDGRNNFYRNTLQLIPVMRSVMAQEHIEEGLSEYWNANSITFLSNDQVRLRSVVSDGEMFHWLNNLDWYAGIPPSVPPPKFRMIFMQNLDPALVTQRYGPPSRIVTVLPGKDLWIYPEERAISYNPIYGGLTNDPAYSSPNEYRVAASALPTQTGTRTGSSITARAGQSRDGAVTYGPYIHLQPGRYLIKIAYAWLSASAPGKTVTYDAVLWNGPSVVTLDAADFPFIDTAPRELAREVRIPKGGGEFEARTFYRGSGDIRIDSLRIIYLGQ